MNVGPVDRLEQLEHLEQVPETGDVGYLPELSGELISPAWWYLALELVRTAALVISAVALIVIAVAVQ